MLENIMSIMGNFRGEKMIFVSLTGLSTLLQINTEEARIIILNSRTGLFIQNSISKMLTDV